jgi:hypothetical protein
VAQPHRRLVGKTVAQVTADLLWAPPPKKKLGDHTTEAGRSSRSDADADALAAMPAISSTAHGFSRTAIATTPLP